MGVCSEDAKFRHGIDHFVLYLGKQKVNERKIMKCRENSEPFII